MPRRMGQSAAAFASFGGNYTRFAPCEKPRNVIYRYWFHLQMNE